MLSATTRMDHLFVPATYATVAAERSARVRNRTRPFCNRYDNLKILIGKRCIVLTPPQQGNVSSSDNLCGQTVTFSCNAGYRLLGSNSSVCGEDSQWSATQPICEGNVIQSIGAQLNIR